MWFYKIGISIVSPWNPKAKLWWRGRKNIFLQNTIGDFHPDNNEVIWMHAASLGEFEQGRPVLEKIRSLYPNSKIVISFFSPSGYEIMKNYTGADYITYLPSDSKKTQKNLLKSSIQNLCYGSSMNIGIIILKN